MNVWTFATYLAWIYGIILLGVCGLLVGCELFSWLRERREDMKAGRVVRLAQDYTVAPDDGPFDQEEYEDFFALVDLSDDPEYIRDGIEQLSIEATFAQKRDVPDWDEGQAA
jgi:hypothetical protein